MREYCLVSDESSGIFVYVEKKRFRQFYNFPVQRMEEKGRKGPTINTELRNSRII